jgi:hypothetical protein
MTLAQMSWVDNSTSARCSRSYIVDRRGRPGYPDMVPELDLLDLLSADHENLSSADQKSLVRTVLQHLTVERELLYPVIEHYVSRGKGIVKTLRDADRLLEERLSRFEAHQTSDTEGEVRIAVGEHIDRLERLFAQVRESSPEQTLQELAARVVLSIEGAPRHPHPGLLHHGRIGEVVEDLADVVDDVRDELRKGST